MVLHDIQILTNDNGTSINPNKVTISIPQSLFTTIGPYFIGCCLNWGGMGVLANQIYTYYLSFPEDPRYVKILVYILGLLQIAQTFIITSDCWNWLVASWAKPDGIIAANLAWFDGPFLVGIISLATQCFYAWRIRMLARSHYLVALIVFLAFAQCTSAFACGVQILLAPNIAEIAPLTPGIIWLAISGSVDVIISCVMVYFLTQQKKKGIKKTDVLITRLVRLTIETGSLTACVAVVEIIIFKVFTNTTFHIVPTFFLAKLYGISLMLIFNNRVQLRRETPGVALGIQGSRSQHSLHFQEFPHNVPMASLRKGSIMTFASTFQDPNDDDFVMSGPIPPLPVPPPECNIPTFKVSDYSPKNAPTTVPTVSFPHSKESISSV